MKKLSVLLIAGLIVQGCGGGGFGTGSSSSASNSTPTNGSSSVGGGGSSSQIQQVDMKSMVDSGPNVGALALDLDIPNKMLKVRIPLASAAMVNMPIFSGTIPQIPGASFQTLVDATGRDVIVISIPLDKFLKGIQAGTPNMLPNGDPLPAVPRGELPTAAIDLDINHNTKLYLYIGVDQIAAFVETPNFDPFKAIPGLPITINQLIVPIKNSHKQLMGYFGFIGSKLGHPGGFYIATALPAEIVQILDNYVFNH